MATLYSTALSLQFYKLCHFVGPGDTVLFCSTSGLLKDVGRGPILAGEKLLPLDLVVRKQYWAARSG